MTYKLKQAQYARIYGVTERSVRTYQGKQMPLDEPGKMSAFLLLQRTPPPGLKVPDEARLLYAQESGISLNPTPGQTDHLEELIWQFWEANNDISIFVRANNWPNAEEIISAGSDVSLMVQRMRKLAGIPDLPATLDEEEG